MIEISNFGMEDHIDSLLQGCSNSNALAMELLQSCTKPSMLKLYSQVCYIGE